MEFSLAFRIYCCEWLYIVNDILITVAFLVTNTSGPGCIERWRNQATVFVLYQIVYMTESLPASHFIEVHVS
jgi:hypothetical protein